MRYIVARQLALVSLVSILSIASSHASALENLSWDLYGTFGLATVDNEALLNSNKVPYSNYTGDLSLDALTKIGIRANYRMSDSIDFTLQALAQGSNDFIPEFEWRYLTFDLSSDTKLRIGKMRRPLFHHSDFYSVGFAYDWVKPPSTVYFDFQELYGDLNAIDLFHRGVYANWNYSVQTYYGEGSEVGNFLGQQTQIDTKKNTGIVVGLEKDNLNLRLGYHTANYSIESAGLSQAIDGLTALGYPQFAADIAISDRDAGFASLSGSYLLPGDWKLFGEYAEMNSPDTLLLSANSYFAGVQRSFGDYTLNYTFGSQRADSSADLVTPITVQAQQIQDSAPQVAAGLNTIAADLRQFIGGQYVRRHSHSVGLRYDLTQTVILKLEAERTTDRTQNDSATSYSLSLDFIY